MHDSLDHLPEGKQEELKTIAEIIKKAAKVEMVILFGSHARGDWVEDRYVEEHVLYEYKSDYDILVIVKNEKREKDRGLWQQLREQIARSKAVKTPVSLIVDSIDYVNEQLTSGRYFYADIKEEGIVLYDSGKHTLTAPKTLSTDERKAIAQEDHALWSRKGEDHLMTYHFNLKEGMHNLAAFHLHQAAESFLICFLLVRTGYRPKTHDLEKMLRDVTQFSQDFQEILPRSTEEDERLFSLLQKAYVDARYNKNYRIKQEELKELEKQLQALEALVEKLCKKTIEEM